MKTPLFLTAAFLALRLAAYAAPEPGQPVFVIVQGAEGEESYGKAFAKQTSLWQQAAKSAGARAIVIGQDAEAAEPDRARLEKTLAAEPREGAAPLWLILIGHGTFDKQEARFNLRGDDVSASELAAWLVPVKRPLALLNTASASAPFLKAVSAPGRIVITATRSGNEQNYARFGGYLAPALGDKASDLDQDGQISLLEAFLSASAKTAEFYKNDGRLATEHALIDDNGDGLGTPAAWFKGLRATKKPADAAAVDGLRAQQWMLLASATEAARPEAWRAQRDALEEKIAALREKKESVPADDYYRQLEPLLIELARLYQKDPS